VQIVVFILTIHSVHLNEFLVAKDSVIVDSVPYVEWSYGSSPQAAAMILSYWDPRSYGRLVDFYFDRWEPLYQEWRYNIPNVLRELALAMHTDTMTGGTYISYIRSGIIYVTDTLNGYDFESQTSPQGGSWNQWCFSWLKSEIDNDWPCIWSVLNYWHRSSRDFINTSLCAIGYMIALPDTFVIVINPWNGQIEPWPLYTYHQGMYSRDYFTTVEPGGEIIDNIFLIHPTDSGFVFQYGDTIHIAWDILGGATNYLELWYASSYDSSEWTLIDAHAPNTGSYDWIAPEESLRTRINLKAFNVMNQLVCADGSYYSFRILPTCISERNIVYPNAIFNVYPTIFNKSLTIEFAPSDLHPYSVTIYDITGHVAKTLKGSGLTIWDGLDDQGNRIHSGVYFVTLKHSDKSLTKKIIYLPSD